MPGGPQRCAGRRRRPGSTAAQSCRLRAKSREAGRLPREMRMGFCWHIPAPQPTQPRPRKVPHSSCWAGSAGRTSNLGKGQPTQLAHPVHPPDAVATAWSTGEKATAQMPRLWPLRVRESTRLGSFHTLAVRSWLPEQMTAGQGVGVGWGGVERDDKLRRRCGEREEWLSVANTCRRRCGGSRTTGLAGTEHSSPHTQRNGLAQPHPHTHPHASTQRHTPESLGATATALMSLSWAATAAVTRSLAGVSASRDSPLVSHTCTARQAVGQTAQCSRA